MKTISIIICLLFTATLAYGDRVCLKKSDGKLIEFQSGDAPLGTLTQNAVNSGYLASDVEEKYVSVAEWEAIHKEWISDPGEAKNKVKKNKQKSGKNKLKALGLTQEEIDSLF